MGWGQPDRQAAWCSSLPTQTLAAAEIHPVAEKPRRNGRNRRPGDEISGSPPRVRRTGPIRETPRPPALDDGRWLVACNLEGRCPPRPTGRSRRAGPRRAHPRPADACLALIGRPTGTTSAPVPAAGGARMTTTPRTRSRRRRDCRVALSPVERRIWARTGSARSTRSGTETLVLRFSDDRRWPGYPRRRWAAALAGQPASRPGLIPARGPCPSRRQPRSARCCIRRPGTPWRRRWRRPGRGCPIRPARSRRGSIWCPSAPRRVLAAYAAPGAGRWR